MILLFVSCVSAENYTNSANTTYENNNQNSHYTYIETNNQSDKIIQEYELNGNNNQNNILNENDTEKQYNYTGEKELNHTDNSTSSTIKRSQFLVSFTSNGILDGSNRVANFIDKNHRLPAVVGIDGQIVNMNDMLYLLCNSLNSSSNVTLGTFDHVSTITGTNKPGMKLTKLEYLDLASSIVDCYNVNGRNPKNIHYKDITLCFDDAVYLYARIARYKYNHGSLIGKINIAPLYNRDYSTEHPALVSDSDEHFTINVNSKSIGNGKYNLTLHSSQQSVIYYTRNGSTPTIYSDKYNGTLTIYNNTWLQFFAVNNENERTPVLSYGVYRTSLPYITSKTKILSNGYENSLNISTSEPSTIYYTTNGSKPTTQSQKYTGTLTIHNNTLLQYFAITNSNQKKSPTYYYKLQNPTPYVTVLNKTDVRNNRQNITIIANKPGKIYYTTNGATPTKNDKQYTPGKILEISIKTKLKAILIDSTNKQSEVILYQPPRVITPSICLISSLWTEDCSAQRITFNFNKITKTINYTTDNSNPKTSNTSQKISLNNDWYQELVVKTGKTLKYYTVSDEGFVSPVYYYKVPLSPQEIPNVKIINLTNVYNDGTQKIGIQMDQPGSKYAYINNTWEVQGFYNELITTENTTIQYEILTNYFRKDEFYVYSRSNGLKYRMNYTYTMQIPYQKLKILINSQIILNLEETGTLNSLKNGQYYIYNYTTKKCTQTIQNKLTSPGLLIYLKNNNITLEYYDYTYGRTNQVSFIKELTGTKQIKTSVINNAIKTEIATTYLPNLNYIDSYFISNTFYKQDYIRDYLSNVKINGKTLETIKTYVLSNQKIDYNIINETLKQYQNYNKNIYKSAYGTYLTGLTHMYLYNAVMTLFASKLNISTYNRENTQMRVNIDINGRTYVDVDDEDYGTKVIGVNQTNNKIYNFLSGVYGSYLEGLVLNLGGDNNSYSAIKYFTEDLLNNKHLNFSFNNKTKSLKITTVDNNDYYITINEDDSYSFTILNNRYTNIKKVKSKNNINNSEDVYNETLELFGGGGSPGYGWNYEKTATENIMDFLMNSLNDLITYGNNWINQLPQDEQELFWQSFNLGEDLAGSILITTAVATYALSAPISVTITCACVGVALCFLATGVNSLDDFDNGYYYMAALPSIFFSVIGVGSIPSKVSKLVGDDVLKKIVWSWGNAIYEKTEHFSAREFIEESLVGQIKDNTYNAFLNSIGLHENR